MDDFLSDRHKTKHFADAMVLGTTTERVIRFAKSAVCVVVTPAVSQ